MNQEHQIEGRTPFSPCVDARFLVTFGNKSPIPGWHATFFPYRPFGFVSAVRRSEHPMRIRTSAMVVALLLALASIASAQETTGTLAGKLQDAQGLALPGVTVTVTGPQGVKSAVSD